MKKLMLTLFLLAGIAVLANAQDTIHTKRTPEEKAARTTKMMQKRLSLTADQSKQINAILLEEAQKSGDMKMKGVKGHGLAKKEDMAEADTKINLILTPDQQKTYAIMEQNIKEKAAQKRKMKDAPVAPATPAQ